MLGFNLLVAVLETETAVVRPIGQEGQSARREGGAPERSGGVRARMARMNPSTPTILKAFKLFEFGAFHLLAGC